MSIHDHCQILNHRTFFWIRRSKCTCQQRSVHSPSQPNNRRPCNNSTGDESLCPRRPLAQHLDRAPCHDAFNGVPSMEISILHHDLGRQNNLTTTLSPHLRTRVSSGVRMHDLFKEGGWTICAYTNLKAIWRDVGTKSTSLSSSFETYHFKQHFWKDFPTPAREKQHAHPTAAFFVHSSSWLDMGLIDWKLRWNWFFIIPVRHLALIFFWKCQPQMDQIELIQLMTLQKKSHSWNSMNNRTNQHKHADD